MKKILLASISVFSVAVLSAQSFTINSPSLGLITNGQTVTYWVDQSTSVETHDFDVMNSSSSSLVAKVRKTVMQQADPGCTFYYCTDLNCYAPTVSLSNNVPMNAATQFALITDFTPNNAIGTSIVRYSVFNTANPSDSVYFFIQYNVAPTLVQSHSLVKASVGNPMPNPASSTFSMSYNLGSSFGTGETNMVVYNMLGASVMKVAVENQEGNIRMDVSTLENGVYFCSLEANGKQVATKRLVISH